MDYLDLFSKMMEENLFYNLFIFLIYFWFIGAISLTIRYVFIDKNDSWIKLDSFSKIVGSILFGFIVSVLSLFWSTIMMIIISEIGPTLHIITGSIDLELMVSFFGSNLVISIILLTIISRNKDPYLNLKNFGIKELNLQVLVVYPAIVGIILFFIPRILDSFNKEEYIFLLFYFLGISLFLITSYYIIKILKRLFK